jgi:hypothetical protein
MIGTDLRTLLEGTKLTKTWSVEVWQNSPGTPVKFVATKWGETTQVEIHQTYQTVVRIPCMTSDEAHNLSVMFDAIARTK